MEVNVKVCNLNKCYACVCFYAPVSFNMLIILVIYQVKSVFGAKMFALGVVIKVPVPKQTAKTNFQVTSGRAKYNASIDCLVWK